jgi:hypothetical protein
VKAPPESTGKRLWAHPAIVTAALAAALTFLAYGGSLRNGFVWDDETLVVKNQWVNDLSRWPDYFTKSYSISSDRLIAKTYRPLQTLSLAADQRLWHGWAGGFHLTSLLIHIAVCVAVFFVFREVVGTLPSSAATALCAVHPALSEGVLCLANRGGQLSALFSLAAVALFLRARRRLDGRHLLSVLAFGFALFAKEPAIALVALLPLLQGVLGRPWPLLSRPTFLLHAPFAATAAVYLVARHAVVGSMTVAPWWGGSPAATLQLQAKVLVVYLRLLVWPFHLQGRYPFVPLRPFPDQAVIASILLHAALMAGTFLGFRKAGAIRLLSLAVLWFYISLLPVSNLIPIPGSMLGERFVYFSFAGMFPLLMGTAAALPIRRCAPVLGLAGAAVAVAFVATDVARTRVWSSQTVFFDVLSRQEPEDPAVQVATAEQEVRDGKQEAATRRLERLFAAERAVADDPNMRIWCARGLLDLGRVRDARRHLAIVPDRESNESNPSADLALLLAEAAARDGDLPSARAALESAAREDANNDAVWNARGNIAWMSGDLVSAASYYREALRLNPQNSEAAINLKGVKPRRAPEAPVGP